MIAELAAVQSIAEEYLAKAHAAKEIANEAVTRLEAVHEMLTVIRDADEDCRKDDLPRLPAQTRRIVDQAIRTCRGES